jgi:hypothetical protein
MAVIGQLRLWTTTHRRLVSLLGALLLAGAVSVVCTPSAQAQALPPECRPFDDEVHLSPEGAYVSVWVHRGCSDGLAEIEGGMFDSACDDREVRVSLEFYNPDAAVNTVGPAWSYRTEEVVHDVGCNNVDGGFEFSSTNQDVEIFVCAWAEGAIPPIVKQCELLD